MGMMAGKGKKRTPRNFYQAALTEAERLLLSQAEEIEGLDEEIALLRLRLRQALQEHPENTELLLKGVAMLVKAVATKYRLSPAAKQNLTEAITQVLKEVGGALYPEGFE